MNPNDEREYTDYDMPQIEEYGDEDREYTHPEEYVDDEPPGMTDVEADADARHDLTRLVMGEGHNDEVLAAMRETDKSGALNHAE